VSNTGKVPNFQQAWDSELASSDQCALWVIERTRFAGARCARSRWRRWSDEV